MQEQTTDEAPTARSTRTPYADERTFGWGSRACARYEWRDVVPGESRWTAVEPYLWVESMYLFEN
jgi:hypothetical protein